MPPFLFYCSVILFVAASALFGVNLMTSPVFVAPDQPQATSAPANKVDAKKAERATVARDDDKAKSDKLLSPIYPTSPGIAKSDVRTVYPPSNPDLAASAEKSPAPAETTGAAAAETKDAAPQSTTPVAPAPAKTEQANAGANNNAPTLNASQFTPAKTDSAQSAPKPSVQPAVQQTANKCDVQACAGAYKSFNAVDCTYQPFEGPRRVCVSPPATASSVQKQEAKQDRPDRQVRKDVGRETDKDAELRDVVRAVKSMPGGNDSARVEEDSSARDGDVYLGGRQRVIIIPDDDDF